jgi:hypothetical protein
VKRLLSSDEAKQIQIYNPVKLLVYLSDYKQRMAKIWDSVAYEVTYTNILEKLAFHISSLKNGETVPIYLGKICHGYPSLVFQVVENNEEKVIVDYEVLFIVFEGEV